MIENMRDKSNIEKIFCPGPILKIIWYGISLLMFGTGSLILWNLIFNPQSFKDIGSFFMDLLLVLIFLPTLFYVINSPIVYVNNAEKYFRIENVIIPFKSIERIKYNYGYLKPHKYSIFSTVFCFVLKSGRKIKFYTYFRGSEAKLLFKLIAMGFLVKRAKVKEL